ncbi:MAG: tagaturonate epimerase family protein [bacterium]|nr:tagaturonate epimerase family protein [bacterium]
MKSLIAEGYKIYHESKIEKDGKIYFLVSKDIKKYLISNDTKFEKSVEKVSTYSVYEKTHLNALRLCNLFKHLKPAACGIKRSFGFGDRLGLATPGHIKTIKGRDIFPILSQQSIREMERTGRSMEIVLDDAMWGVFQEGYRKGYGADIDHVKEQDDVIKACEHGYTMYTIDPSDYINDNVKDMSHEELTSTYESIPNTDFYEKLYLGKNYKIGANTYKMTKTELMNIISVYAKALEHIVNCYNIVKERILNGFDFEASVDETDTPTTLLAHIFIVEELRRNGVNFTSLALRFIGEFEKGIDYIGDIEIFKKDFLAHADICRHFGRYKLSIHSGSDKFSIYPTIAESTEGVFHIKTAGTNWLEAVRLISHKNPALYRRMHQIALSNFEKDRKSYHVTTDLSRIPALSKLSDEELPGLLNENNSRQLLHITYGSILKDMKEEIYKTLNIYENEHYEMLETHLGKHLDYATSSF